MSHVVPLNSAASVRGPARSVRQGKTPVLDLAEARTLNDSINVATPVGLRDRALIALMVYSFGRIGAALAMQVEDLFTQDRRLWVRLREKGSKRHEMPCHHSLDEYLHAYLGGTGIAGDSKGPLFWTVGRGTGRLTRSPLPQANAYAMVRRRAMAAGIETKIGTTASGRRASPPILRTAARWRTPPPWPTTPAPARRRSTTAGRTASASTRSSGSGFQRARPRDARRPAIKEGAMPDDPRLDEVVRLLTSVSAAPCYGISGSRTSSASWP